MNDLIKELAKQIGWSEDIRYAPRAKEIEKFAELIIDEMYCYMSDANEKDEGWPSYKEVKQHFGVE